VISASGFRIEQMLDKLLDNAVEVPVYTPGWLWMYAVTAKAPGFKVGPFNRPLFNDVKL